MSAAHQPTYVVLSDNEGIGSIQVDLEAFFGFSFWLAEELEDLEADHAHWRLPPRRPLLWQRPSGQLDSAIDQDEVG